MGFLKKIRSRTKLRSKSRDESTAGGWASTGTREGVTRVASYRDLPEPVLKSIFEYVAPHVTDQTYEASEHSIAEGCPLCDLRDLAHCAAVSRGWNRIAQHLLYRSVRIDAVHYCALEEELQELRRKRSKHGDQEDVPAVRLRLFCETVRRNPQLAREVQWLKLPYMTRESCKPDLARTVQVLPRLLYIDLPEGCYRDDPTTLALRQELLSRCPDLRKMQYKTGASASFTLLAQGVWQNLEVIEVDGLDVEPVSIRMALASLTGLRDLRFSNMAAVDDSMFQSVPGLPNFPHLEKLSLTGMSKVTISGLLDYLSLSMAEVGLQSLTLVEMPQIQLNQIHFLLDGAHFLEYLHVETEVRQPMGLEPTPPLASQTLRTLHFEISSGMSRKHTLQDPTKSYYAYLARSLHANTLPSLRDVFVRDPSFPETLLSETPLVAPVPHFAQNEGVSNNPFHSNRTSAVSAISALPQQTAQSTGSTDADSDISAFSFSNGSMPNKPPPLPATNPNSNIRASFASNNPFLSIPNTNNTTTTTNGPPPPLPATGTLFTHPLNIYAKGLDELDWILTSITPPSNPTNLTTRGPGGSTARPSSSGGRPLSAATATLGPQWNAKGAAVRQSVVVGNGFGGLLAVPDTDPYAQRKLRELALTDPIANSTGTGTSMGGHGAGHMSFAAPSSFQASSSPSLAAPAPGSQNRQSFWGQLASRGGSTTTTTGGETGVPPLPGAAAGGHSPSLPAVQMQKGRKSAQMDLWR